MSIARICRDRMKERDFVAESIHKGELAPGDIIRCIDGKTYRTVLLADDERVVVEGRSGLTESLPFSALSEHWMKMIPKDSLRV